MKKVAIERVENAFDSRGTVSRNYVEGVLKMNWNTFRKCVSFLRDEGWDIDTTKVKSKGEYVTAYQYVVFHCAELNLV